MIQKNRALARLRRQARLGIYKLVKVLGEDLHVVALDGALSRCKSHTPTIGTVIDVGASDGRWTNLCRQFYPGACYFLIEAQLPHQPALQALKAKTPNLDFIMAAAGDQEGEIYFDASNLFGGIASHTPFQVNNIVVPVTTIDAQVRQRRLPPPYLIKLDTHGFELPILSGAVETLKETALVVMETYNFNFTPENIRFHEMVTHMEKLGFRCVDLSEPLHRPGDQALYQFDLFFIPANHPLFSQNTFIPE